jgi:hypothetical protein
MDAVSLKFVLARLIAALPLNATPAMFLEDARVVAVAALPVMFTLDAKVVPSPNLV